MPQLIYFEERDNHYQALYTYDITAIGIDECYARQLCTYTIIQGEQYELLANELVNDDEYLIVKHIAPNEAGECEQINEHNKGIQLEIRNHDVATNYALLQRITCSTHYEIIRYLLKDNLAIQATTYHVRSSEIDEDRGVYVLYVMPL